MQPYRKFASLLIAIAVPLGLLASLSISGPAFAKSTKGTGTVTCSGNTSTISFKPPLTPTGSSPETTKVKTVALGTCTGGTPASPKGTKITTTISGGATTNSCANFATATGSRSLTLVVKWAGGLEPTTVQFAAGSISLNSSKNGFNAAGGVASGSYSTNSATLDVTLSSTSLTELTNCIGGKGTVSGLSVTSTSTL